MSFNWQLPGPSCDQGRITNGDGQILKVGLACVEDGCLLLVRKRSGASFILPGGKPEGSESDAETLRREVGEELSCELVDDSLQWIGDFEDDAADLPGKRVTVRLYRGELRGKPSRASEIVEVRWFDADRDDQAILAPSLRRQILPALRASDWNRAEISNCSPPESDRLGT